jgi:hypothetical protein
MVSRASLFQPARLRFFFTLVRYGIRRAGDSLIENSLRVVDAVLKVDTPRGNCWRGTTMMAMDSERTAGHSRDGDMVTLGRS